MNDAQYYVQKFHEAMGQPVGDHPQMILPERQDLRLKLIKEELKELTEAFEKDDLVEAYDACLDILYVTYGTLVELGLDAEPGFEEVQRSNMSKLGEDGKAIHSRGEELDGFPKGKVLKGPNYSKPDLATIIVQQTVAAANGESPIHINE